MRGALTQYSTALGWWRSDLRCFQLMLHFPTRFAPEESKQSNLEGSSEVYARLEGLSDELSELADEVGNSSEECEHHAAHALVRNAHALGSQFSALLNLAELWKQLCAT